MLDAHDDQTLGTFNRKGFADVMDVNAFAPLAITEAFRDNIVSSRQKKVVALTSGLGSIRLAGGMPKGPYYYRMSKAALNMGMQRWCRPQFPKCQCRGSVAGVAEPLCH